METNTRPTWAAKVKVGDWLTVKEEYGLRGGADGEVVAEPNEQGVSLDFYCDREGNESGVPSIEFWEWSELEPLN